jgi:hypothetical protein
MGQLFLSNGLGKRQFLACQTPRCKGILDAGKEVRACVIGLSETRILRMCQEGAGLEKLFFGFKDDPFFSTSSLPHSSDNQTLADPGSTAQKV